MALSDSGKTVPPRGAVYYLLFLLLIIIMAMAAVFLLPVYRTMQKKTGEYNERQVKADALRSARAELAYEVNSLSAPAGVEKVGREKFNLVRENESVMKYPEPARK